MIIWNVLTGEVVRALTFHTGPVQCIIRLDENRMCSGGGDKLLFVWDHDGNEVGRIERQENENLHCMLSVGSRVVTGSSSSLLLVYNPESWSFVTILAYHRESVTCLERITQTHFASGSLDGAIVVWHADTLKPSKILSFPEKFRSDFDHQYTFHVRSLVQLNQRFLATATGNGFAVYDLFTGDKVLDKADAHEAACLRVLPLYKGRKLATCSDDGTVKLWGPGPEMDLHMGPLPAGSSSPAGGSGGAYSPVNGSAAGTATAETATFRGLFSSKKKVKALAPLLLGEMAAHSAPITDIARINQTSFVSVAADKMVILWKDGQIQRQLRNHLAIASLLYHSDEPLALPLDVVADPIVPSVRPQASSRRPTASASSGATAASKTPAPAAPAVPKAELNRVSTGFAGVPSYILTFARTLKDEKQLSTAQVAVHLEEQGHSKQIIDAVRQALGDGN